MNKFFRILPLFSIFFSSSLVLHADLNDFDIQIEKIPNEFLKGSLILDFYHIVENVSIQMEGEILHVRFQADAKLVQSNFQILFNQTYFFECTIYNVMEGRIFPFDLKSLNISDDRDFYMEIFEKKGIARTHIVTSLI